MRFPFADELLASNGCAGVVGVTAVFSGDPPPLDEVRSRVVERWGPLDRMSWVRAAPHNQPARFHWTCPGRFDAAVQVLDSGEKLEDLLASHVDRPLGYELPPWRLLVVRDTAYGGDFALALVAQHALLDGRSLVTLLELLLDDAPDPAPALRPPCAAGTEGPGWRKVGRELLTLFAPGQAIPLGATGGSRPSVATAALPSEVVRTACRRRIDGRRVTLNHLLVASVTGALSTRYGPAGRWPRGSRPVYAMVPCDVRGGHEASELGNIVAAPRFPLPLDLDDPVDRLRASGRLVADIRHRGRAQKALGSALETARHFAPWLTRALGTHGADASHVAAAITTLKWPVPAGSWNGSPLIRLVCLSPLHRPGSAAFSLADAVGTVTLTVVCHLSAGEAQRLVEAVTQEMEALAEYAG
ncbi:WS/DGAT domain-containing protein [Streptomyces sp. SA15]|uniref:WS/DGAT domain-containing protein n=1 Tax=Streptomyces sp. SA15 TaxID=934019 RepID=UPI0015C861BC|nr:WS/DGAT domain-containing protein [Streptomyces sp. SA15]